ncbi:hypothetical protein KEM55_007448 [Ascosphaera atra]|nr:hypothetical protein KEM55_007448 [Ascosphaera atra]
MLEKTAKCVEHLEETGLYACVDALLKNEKWLMMWMLYSPNFQDRTGANWQLIDEIAQQNHITCEAEDEDEDEDEDMDYSEDEEQDVASRGQHFSHHFFNVIAPFRYAQILMEAVKSPAEGPFFKAILNIEEIDPKDIDGIPGNARTSCSFERLHQTEDSDTESDISTPAGPRLHPELQVAEAIQTLPSIPGMDSHISTSRPVCRACEALFRSGMFGDVNVRKGANFYNLITGS